ncbi:MAG TPA: ABC transporter substrate-binding protein [Ideonella sp.]|nr:ABC transporter substrate-binding protein [Ideonella sp.]
MAFEIAETGFDPPQVSDHTSVTVNAHIFEAPLCYDYLARPAALRPLTAAALPEVSADFRHFVFTLRPGIFFADDPAFGGKPRELVAADYVYTIKRYYDPRIKTEHLYRFENAGLLGLGELRQRALKDKTPFAYDEEVAGLRALDRYRFELRLDQASPRFAHVFASPGWTGAVAREVVEAYADDLMAHPVGTGPFRLAQWRRASLIVLARNPGFREQVFDSLAPVGDAAALAAQQHLLGQRLPRLDRVEIAIVQEAQPRWLAFYGGEHDLLELPPEFAPLAVPGGTLAPYLARRGVQAQRVAAADVAHTFFNGDDPLVGGTAPAQVALRRAVALAFDEPREIRLLMRDQAVPAQSLIPPPCHGHDPLLRSRDDSGGRLARARALLDTYGYVDRNGDGYREAPDGSPLTLRLASRPDQSARARNELWRSCMDKVGLRMAFEVAHFGELIRRALAGQLMMWGFSWMAGEPDADFFLGMGYSRNIDQSNDARFRLPAFDRLYEQQRSLPDGPQRLALMAQANRLLLAYMPYLPHYHRITTDLLQPHVRGHVRHPFRRDVWRFVDLA